MALAVQWIWQWVTVNVFVCGVTMFACTCTCVYTDHQFCHTSANVTKGKCPFIMDTLGLRCPDFLVVFVIFSLGKLGLCFASYRNTKVGSYQRLELRKLTL